jgi:CxxC motif-containing protein
MKNNSVVNEQRICIVCPAGCRLTISGCNADNLIVTGGKCKRGITYGQSEIIDPRRMVTAVVPGAGVNDCCIPVKTDKPLPRELIDKLLAAIYSTRVELPVYAGDILINNFRGTQVNVVATRTMI